MIAACTVVYGVVWPGQSAGGVATWRGYVYSRPGVIDIIPYDMRKLTDDFLE